MVMDFGLLMPFRNPPEARVPWERLYREQLELAVLADHLGFGHIWLTEHHFVEDGYTPSLLPIAAAVAARTEDIRIGTFVLLIPFNNAFRVAEDAATVDIISNGRFDLGLGQGYRVGEFTGFNIPRKERGERLAESVEIIRRAWTEQHWSHEGKYYRLTDVTLAPPPIQKPHPPIWLGARRPKSMARLARHGYGLMAMGGVDQQKLYDAVLREHGKNPQDHPIAQLRLVYVAPTREQAWDVVEAPSHYMMSQYGQWVGEAADLPGDEFFGAQLPPVGALRHADTGKLFGEPFIIGTPDDVIRMIEEYQQCTRFTHLVMATALPGVDPHKVRESLELFAKEVIPHFRQKVGPR